MADTRYRFLKITAVVMAVAWFSWEGYRYFAQDHGPGYYQFEAAEKYFEDGEFKQALAEYNGALQQDPDNVYFTRAKARTLMQLNQYAEALQLYNQAIDMAPEFAGTYANRGILYDHMGQYHKAIADYDKALAMDPELAKGPNWLTRFLRLQPQKPPTIKDRAEYLKQELAKPESERVLRVPEADDEQRSYKM
jgi:tetratricopeptide (TPR) repeat protein